MARYRKHVIEIEAEPQLDISSLIDVCFLLLIYFLATMTIIPRESDLGLVLPTENEKSPNSSPIEAMFVRIEANGAVFTGSGKGERQMDLDTNSRDLPLLSSQLNLYRDAARSAGETPLVQIWVDPEAGQQRVVDVLNALAGAGIVSVTFTDLVEPT